MNRIIIRALRLGSLVEKNDLPAFDTDGNTENIPNMVNALYHIRGLSVCP